MPEGTARRRKLTPNGSGFFRGLYRPEMNFPEATISALLYFDKCPTAAALADEFERHLWPLYRFNSVIKDNHWVPFSGQMDRSYHFKERAVADEDEITTYTQSVMAIALDHEYPLWQYTVLKANRGRSAALIRVHHTISDGMGLLFAYLPTMAVEGNDPLSKIPLPGMLTGRKSSPNLASSKSSPMLAAEKPKDKPKTGLLRMVLTCLRGCVSGPIAFLRGVLSLLIMKSDSALKMNGQRPKYLPYGGSHVYTRMPSVSMDAVRRVRAKHSCTVNDAIMAALAGALRRYGADDLKDPLLTGTGKVECKSFMLVALPRPIDAKDASPSLVNNILTPIFRIPIDEPTAAGRLRKAVAMGNDLKSPAYLTGIKLTTKLITGVAPTKVMRDITSEAISKGTSNITCLPLPTVPFKFGGEEVKEAQCIFVNNIPQISLLTYNGNVHWNIVHDPALIPNARKIGEYFLSEFDELAK